MYVTFLVVESVLHVSLDIFRPNSIILHDALMCFDGRPVRLCGLEV